MDNPDPLRCARIILHKSAGLLWISNIYGADLARQGAAGGLSRCDVPREKSRDDCCVWHGSNPRVAVTLIS